MTIFLLIFSFFIIVFLIMYIPAIYHHQILNQANENLDKEISLLDSFYQEHLVIITEKRGLGSSKNSDIQFAVAHEHQAFAISSILSLMNELGD